MQFKEPNLEVKPAQETFEFWLNQPFISASARDELESANLLIAPRDSYRGPRFLAGSKEFLNYCISLNEGDLHAQLCIGDADYHELLLFSYDVFLPDCIVERIIIPIYVKVMSGYISEKIQARFGGDIRVNTKVTIVDKDTNIATEFSYRGKPADYENTVASTLKLIHSSADLKLAAETEDLSVAERIERLSDNGNS